MKEASNEHWPASSSIRADRERDLLRQVSAAIDDGSAADIDTSGLADTLCASEIEWQDLRARLRAALLDAVAGGG